MCLTKVAEVVSASVFALTDAAEVMRAADKGM